MFFISIFLFGGISIATFVWAPRAYAIWIVLIGGWLLLPPTVYPVAGNRLVFPFWIIGSALPSDLLIAKVWVVPAITLLVSLGLDRRRWSRFQTNWADFAILAFCLWPLGQAFFVTRPDPSALLSSLYLFGSWGLTWLIGRIYLREQKDVEAFATVLVLATLIMLPLIVIEGVSTFRIHTALFGQHPFVFDGVERYAGYRPQLLFEHGNQYGIWCAIATFAAFWRMGAARSEDRCFWIGVSCILLAITIASQSIGAILLLLMALAMYFTPNSFKLMRSIAAITLAISLVLGLLYVSEIVPLRSIGKTNVIGKAVVDSIRASGKGSFVWRVGQDLKALPLVKRNPIIGSGRWNWFDAANSRPWGLPLLVLGQFGLIGAAMLAMALLSALYRHINSAAQGCDVSRLFTVVLLMFGLDALMNSFLFYPAILVAAAHTRSEYSQKRPRPSDGQHMIRV